jgi:putative transposase
MRYNIFMHRTEVVIIKVANPTRRKAEWLENTARSFSRAVQLGLDAAREGRTASRNKLHKVVYRSARDLGLPADYARMAVNASVALARSFYGLRKAGQKASYPKVNGLQGVGLGINAYALVQNGSRFVLRVSTGKRGEYIWLPLCVSAKYRDRLLLARGDAKLLKRGSDWYVSLPIRITPTPAGCSGAFIGADLGIVRHAVLATPDRVVFFSGKEARHRREHFADIRRRYQRHKRTDRVKDQRGKESRWMRDINHKLSHAIVDLACQYSNPVIVLEKLDGIRSRARGSKRFNRMMSSWTFRQLADFLEYKAARAGVQVLYIDPRGTSKTCPRCGHATRSNRPDQGHFRCVSCGYQANADMVAARNIAAAGASLWQQGQPDTARPDKGQTGEVAPRPDGVKDCSVADSGKLCDADQSDPNLSLPVGTIPL